VAQPPPSDRSPAAHLPLAVLSAIGAGVGGLAFFTFVGGAITAARFRGVGISGTKAVALVPKADLLAVGAQALLVPCVVALLALVAFVPLARDRWLRRSFLLFLGVAGLVWLWAWTPYQPWWWWHPSDVFLLLLAVGVAGAIAVDRLAPSLPSGSPFSLHPLSGIGRQLFRRVRRSATARGPSRAPAAGMLFLVIALAGTVTYFGASRAKPSLHEMVILRTDGRPPLCGLYVGESDNDVWIAVHKNQNDWHDWYVAELPRAMVAALAIGPTHTMTKAKWQKRENEMEMLRFDLSRRIQNPVQEATCPTELAG
jgi:hypothetical protein